mmetsp:Transcript_19521/g.74912  ORF Transcript_19521/g.74912 Transcript_19521/m.74912 type:complete len:257 (-) Transcript_19521:153-923(-)
MPRAPRPTRHQRKRSSAVHLANPSLCKSSSSSLPQSVDGRRREEPSPPSLPSPSLLCAASAAPSSLARLSLSSTKRNVLSSPRMRGPRPGVEMRMATTWPSTGGMAAPVPWAPTCVKPPICCSRMLAKFWSVRPRGRRAAVSCSTVAPTSTVTRPLRSSTSRIRSQRRRSTIAESVRPMPLGESAEPTGANVAPVFPFVARRRSTCSTLAGLWYALQRQPCVPDQFSTSCSSPLQLSATAVTACLSSCASTGGRSL